MYIMGGDRFRHIPYYREHVGGGGGGGGNMLKMRQNTEEKKTKQKNRLANFNIFFGVLTSYFLKMILCI